MSTGPRVGTMLPLVGFPIGTGAGLQTSCGNHASTLDPLTQLGLRG